MKRISGNAVTLIGLLAVAAAAYGGSILSLGFTWDDWPYLWVGHMSGPLGYIPFVATDRPFSAWIFMLTFAVFGEHPLGYHLLAVTLRWLGGAGLWWTLSQVWPGRRWAAAAPALLLLVYPAFSQQPIALVYNHHFTVLAMLTFSLGGMLYTASGRAKHPRLVTVLSLTGAAGMFSLEYFVGLELLRPLLLYLVLPRGESRWRRVFKTWLPYAALLAAFLVWRVAIFGFPSYDPIVLERISASGLDAAADQARVILTDMLEGGLLAWQHALPEEWADQSALTWGSALIALGAAAVTLVSAGKTEDRSAPDNRRWQLEAVLLGLAAVFLAGWPFWITKLDLRLDGLRDRLTLAFIPGAALLVTGVIGLLPRRWFARSLLIAALVGGSAGWQAANSARFAENWGKMKEFFWQLTWRAPGLQSGTSLLTNDISLGQYSDNSLTAALNWIYAPDFAGRQMPYLLDFISVRLGVGLSSLEEDSPITQDYRSMVFIGNTNQALVIDYEPPGCLRVIDPQTGGEDSSLPELLRDAANISHPEQIEIAPSVPAAPPVNIFGVEPAPGWCMAYEKASLAAQQGDWPKVVSIAEEAYTLTPGAQAGVEHVVFAEGYARTGELPRAGYLLNQAVSMDERARPETCLLLRRLAKTGMPKSALGNWIDVTEVQTGCEAGD